jgi:hypothetical protein
MAGIAGDIPGNAIYRSAHHCRQSKIFDFFRAAKLMVQIMKLSILVAVFNEIATIAAVIRAVGKIDLVRLRPY